MVANFQFKENYAFYKVPVIIVLCNTNTESELKGNSRLPKYSSLVKSLLISGYPTLI